MFFLPFETARHTDGHWMARCHFATVHGVQKCAIAPGATREEAVERLRDLLGTAEQHDPDAPYLPVELDAPAPWPAGWEPDSCPH
jgi:hypothetical protein